MVSDIVGKMRLRASLAIAPHKHQSGDVNVTQAQHQLKFFECLERNIWPPVASVAMPDRSQERRQFAAECLTLAQRASDLKVRASLIDMAQKWLELAGERNQALCGVIRDFNQQQLLDVDWAA